MFVVEDIEITPEAVVFYSENENILIKTSTITSLTIHKEVNQDINNHDLCVVETKSNTHLFGINTNISRIEFEKLYDKINKLQNYLKYKKFFIFNSYYKKDNKFRIVYGKDANNFLILDINKIDFINYMQNINGEKNYDIVLLSTNNQEFIFHVNNKGSEKDSFKNLLEDFEANC